MATNRNVVLANEEIYHTYNRGIEKRQIFTDAREYHRFIQVMRYYKASDPPVRYSFLTELPREQQRDILLSVGRQPPIVTVLCYCLMPNHFHIVLRQEKENGITDYISQITNSYAKYFNTKHDRAGHLFQGPFKAVRIQDEDQLIHVSRYVHINPAASFMVETDKLHTYSWSSYGEYTERNTENLCDTSPVMARFSSKDSYKKFVLDQVSYARELEQIKHLAIDR